MCIRDSGKDFEKDPTPNSPEHKATIRAKTDDQYYYENKVNPVVDVYKRQAVS